MRTWMIPLVVSSFSIGTNVAAEVVPVGAVQVTPSDFDLDTRDDPKRPRPLSQALSDERFPVRKLDQALGAGYDYLTGSIKPKICIAAGGVPDLRKGGEGKPVLADKFEYINAVSGMSSHQSASGQSAGFNVVYKLISVGGEGETQSENYFNTVDSFARIYSRFVTRSVERINGKWGPGVRDLAKRADKRRFLEVCGTHYISAIYYGHVIDQTVRFTLSDGKQTKSDKATLTLGIGEIFGANYGTSDREAKARSVSSVSVIDQSRGIIATDLPDPQQTGGVQLAASYAHITYPAKVMASEFPAAEALLIDVQPYLTIDDAYAGSIPQLSESLTAQVSARLSLYETLLGAISDINNAGRLPDTAFAEFFKGSKSDLPARLTKALAFKATFAKAIDKCVDTIKRYSAADTEGACTEGLSTALSPELVASVALEAK